MHLTADRKAFAAQMHAFFGLLPGHGLQDFAAELKALSEQDKHELAVMLTAAGYPCEPPRQAVA